MDNTIGAGEVHSEDDALTKAIEHDNVQLDRLIELPKLLTESASA